MPTALVKKGSRNPSEMSENTPMIKKGMIVTICAESLA